MKINEYFLSIQGEGPHIGTPSLFIRTCGCNLSCTWCDTKQAQNIGVNIPGHYLMEFIHTLPSHITHVVLTGGEPTIQDEFSDLVTNIISTTDLHVTIETNGTHEERLSKFTNNPKVTIVCCPKTLEHLKDLYNYGYTFKYVVDPNQIDVVGKFLSTNNLTNIYLMPLGTTPEEVCIGSYAILDMIDRYNLKCRLSPRLHILLGVK